MVGHLLEFHGAVHALKRMVDSGALGKLEYVYSNRLNMGRVRQEENALWSFAPHDIAILLRLVGEMPIQVTATGGAYLQPNVADVTVTNLLFDGGLRAHIFVSWLHPFKEQKLVVIGTKGMVVFNDVVPSNKLQYFDRDVENVAGEVVVHRVDGVPVEYDETEPLRAELEHFLTCVETRSTPRTDALEGLRVLSVLQASQRSIQVNGEPIVLRANLQEIIWA
jgi:predicted dehydrogenase